MGRNECELCERDKIKWEEIVGCRAIEAFYMVLNDFPMYERNRTLSTKLITCWFFFETLNFKSFHISRLFCRYTQKCLIDT